MKKMNKILALTMTLALLLCLCACGGNNGNFEADLRAAQEKMADLKSEHLDMDLDVSMKVSVMGQSQAMDISANYSVDVQTDPAKSKMDVNMSVMGSSQSILAYSETVGNDTVVYMSQNNGRTWQKSSAQTSGIQTPADPSQALDLFIKNADSFKKTGTESINGSQATVYSGVLDSKYVEEVMEMTGMDSTLGDTLGMVDSADLFRNLGDIPMTIAIDNDSGMVVRYTMDMTDLMENLMKNVFDALMSQNGMSGIEVKVEIDKCLCTATLSQFNSVPEIVIPDAAKAA